MKENSIKKLHIIIIIIGTIFISLSIFHTSLWFDETYSVGIADHSFAEIWKIGGNDVHPVLYYWMLRIVCLLTGGSILAYRIFSAIPIVLLGLIGFTHIRKDFGEKTGILFSFLTFFLPISAVYANQIRMYSWAFFILSIFFIYAYRLYKGEESVKNWIIFGISSLCSIYIHYYGLMAAGITNVMLLIYFIKNKNKKAIRNIIISGTIQLFLYIPWLFYFIGQLKHVSKGFWITMGLTDIFKIIGCQLIGELPIYVGTLLSVLLYIYLFIRIWKNRKQADIKPMIFSIGIYVLVIIAALAMELVLHTAILYYRYLFVITGLFVFFISYFLAHENKYITFMICTIILILGTINNIYQIKENYNPTNLKAVEFLKENIQEDDDIIYQHIGAGAVIAVNFENKQYFYNPEDWGVEEAYKAYGPQMKTYTTNDFIEEFSKRIWVVDTYDDSIYDKFFNNEDYKLIKEDEFSTEYYEYYPYRIKLVERIGK